MSADELLSTLEGNHPPAAYPPPLAALWWDAKGDWAQAHSLIDDLETPEAMAVHAYLHRKEGDGSNAEYWYRRSGRDFYRPELAEEWKTLVEELPETSIPK